MGLFSKLFGKKKDGTSYLSEQEMDAICDHFSRFIGDPANVFHELVSDEVHIDVHIISEVPGKDIMVIFTTGMSALPMPGLGPEEAFAEVFAILPQNWDIRNTDDERNYWPVAMLKQLARIPTDYATALTPGISMPNGDPAEFFPDTRFKGVMTALPTMFPADFGKARLKGKTLNFLAMVPMTEREMEWKIQQAAGTALLSRYFEMGIDPMRVALIDPQRDDLV